MIGDWLFLVVVASILGGLAFAGVTLLVRRTPFSVPAGAALILIAGFVPLLLAFVYPFGIAAAVAGAGVAAVRSRRRLAWAGWILVAAAVVVLVGEPALLINASEVQAEETYSRCAADKAVAAIEKSRAEGRGYPADMREVAQFDGEYGDNCYVSNGVNWLYRVSAPGTYTVGYWVDWRATRHVCLHTARSQGWTCGFETWGPFKPGEVD
jgi:hypothetical protein